jgi:hypothetical protein
LKCDGTRAETRFRLPAKRTSPFKSTGASVHSTTGSRGERISGSNAGYTMFRGSVKSTGYPRRSPVSPSLPLPCVTMYHHISTGLYHSSLASYHKGHCREFCAVNAINIRLTHASSLRLVWNNFLRFVFVCLFLWASVASHGCTAACWLIVPPALDVPTLATRCPRAYRRVPHSGGGSWNLWAGNKDR